MSKKIYVLDTSVYLTDANSVYSFGRNDIVVPLKVLEEIDKHKKRQDGVGANARSIIRILDKLRSKGNLNQGVRVEKYKGMIYAKNYDPGVLPSGFDISNPDNEIIATALTEKRNNPKKEIVVVSRDINMRVKCDALQVKTHDFISDEIISNTDDLFTGMATHLVDEQVVDMFYAGEDVFISAEEAKLHPNQFVMLISNSNEKKTALARFNHHSEPLKKIVEFKNGLWGIRPRNKEQAFAANLLMDESVPIVTIVGKAGTGKTLYALSAALEQVVESQKYTKILVSRPVQPMGKDIGFLPGDIKEKLLPWLMPVQDNLQFLMGNDKTTLEMYMENGTIEIEALSYIRGRSISNAFIIIDETQNLSKHELKTIITRVGEGTKIVLTGDIEQIDSMYLDSTSNGLSHAVESFKVCDLSGHVTLLKGERSKVATLAAKVL